MPSILHRLSEAGLTCDIPDRMPDVARPVREAERVKALSFARQAAEVLGDVDPAEIADAFAEALKDGSTHSARGFFWAQVAHMIRNPGCQPKIRCYEV